MLVAVIDDGVLSDRCAVGALREDLYVARLNRVCSRGENEKIDTPHGTTVAGIIKKYAPDAELCSIRIFSTLSEGKLRTTSGKLVAALKWCLKTGVPLINLSLGCVEKRDFASIERIVHRLLKNGQIIVAACNANGRYTVPAMQPGVIGVRTDAQLSGNEWYREPEEKGGLYVASSKHELFWTPELPFLTQLSTSYAAPTITAAIASGQLHASN